MKALLKTLAVGAAAFALFGLNSCCDKQPQVSAPVYEAPAK
ncbi:MAG: hypothetical protein ACSHYF_17890 [Verrucomicrobiaceae bacterium]